MFSLHFRWIPYNSQINTFVIHFNEVIFLLIQFISALNAIFSGFNAYGIFEKCQEQNMNLLFRQNAFNKCAQNKVNVSLKMHCKWNDWCELIFKVDSMEDSYKWHYKYSIIIKSGIKWPCFILFDCFLNA